MKIFLIIFLLASYSNVFNLIYAADFKDFNEAIIKHGKQLAYSNIWVPFNELNDIENHFKNSSNSFSLSEISYNELRRIITKNIIYYSGQTPTPIPNECIEKEMLRIFDILDLSSFKPVTRLDLLETLIKSGSIACVENLTNKLLDNYPSDLFDHAKIMKKDSLNRPDRPLFWLAAIVTRWNLEKVPEENYQKIEKFLTDLLCPAGTAIVWGELLTRQQYVDKINRWKEERHNQN